jgi:hypothetical protein
MLKEQKEACFISRGLSRMTEEIREVTGQGTHDISDHERPLALSLSFPKTSIRDTGENYVTPQNQEPTHSVLCLIFSQTLCVEVQYLCLWTVVMNRSL